MSKKESNNQKGAERGQTLFKLSVPPIIVVAVLILICAYVVYLQYASLVQKGQQVQQVAEAERMAALLGGRLVALGDSVAAQARPERTLIVALQQDDSGAIRLYERSLKSYFPEAVRIRIVRPTDTDPDMSVRPPIGYACLDLARQAESGTERPPLEMHLHGSEFAHMDIVRPIEQDGVVVASLMVSFSAEKVEEWLNKLIVDEGYVELQQGWEGPVMGHIGNEALKSGKAVHRAVISGSSWQLSFWPGQGVGMAEVQMATFFASFGITLLLVVIVMYFYARYLSRTVSRELQGMTEFMVQSSRGHRFHSYPVKMLEMERALQAMEPVLQQQQSSPNNGLKEKAEQGDEGAPDMMFMDFGEITVEEGDVPAAGDADKS